MDRVTLDIEDGLAMVSLNRPDKLNAMDMPMFDALNRTIGQIKRNRTVRVVIVRGEGVDFCSGLDIKSVMTQKTSALRLLLKWRPGATNLAQRVAAGWRSLSIPVIMVLHGRVWGAGMQVALGGDFRICAPDCSLAIMESRWGLIPDMGGTVSLREIMPLDQAMKLAMTGQTINAQQALAVGLVSEIEADPLARAKAFAHQLRQQSPDTTAAIKKLYHKAWHSNDSKLFRLETWYQIRILTGKNQSTAVKRQINEPDKPWYPPKKW